MILIIGGRYQGKTAYALHLSTELKGDMASKEATCSKESSGFKGGTDSKESTGSKASQDPNEGTGSKRDIGLITDPGIVLCDLAHEGIARMFEADVIKNIQEGIRRLLAEGIKPSGYFEDHIHRLEHKVLIGTEIGCGIVPLEEEERMWRDETGRVYQLLAERARKVVRIWAGIPITIKDSTEGPQVIKRER